MTGTRKAAVPMQLRNAEAPNPETLDTHCCSSSLHDARMDTAELRTPVALPRQLHLGSKLQLCTPQPKLQPLGLRPKSAWVVAKQSGTNASVLGHAERWFGFQGGLGLSGPWCTCNRLHSQRMLQIASRSFQPVPLAPPTGDAAIAPRSTQWTGHYVVEL